MSACSTLDIVYFVNPRETHPPLRSERYVADALVGGFRGEVNVCICEREPAASQDSLWQRYLRPASGLLRMHDYACYAGVAQRQAVEGMLRHRPNVVMAEGLQGMIPLMLTKMPLPPVFFEFDDVEHVVFARSILHPPVWRQKYLTYLQIPALLWGEARAIRVACKVMVCSELDRRSLQRMFATRKVAVLENAITLPKAPAPSESARTLLFVGSYEYPPNRLAAEFMLDSVWPLIRAAEPDARLILAGPNPERIRHHGTAPDGVSIPGFVDDLDSLYASAAVVVCPIRSGGGTRIKLIEAAGYGKPIVSTIIGAEGLEFADGTEILLRDAPADFAAACVALLRDPPKAQLLGARARTTALRRFDRAVVVERLRGWLVTQAQQSMLREA
ncbi:MAG: glycosyltransferase family 4 protein [Burkholderiales bacterium]